VNGINVVLHCDSDKQFDVQVRVAAVLIH
jgi:hypothetical protein